MTSILNMVTLYHLVTVYKCNVNAWFASTVLLSLKKKRPQGHESSVRVARVKLVTLRSISIVRLTSAVRPVQIAEQEVLHYWKTYNVHWCFQVIRGASFFSPLLYLFSHTFKSGSEIICKNIIFLIMMNLGVNWCHGHSKVECLWKALSLDIIHMTQPRLN